MIVLSRKLTELLKAIGVNANNANVYKKATLSLSEDAVQFGFVSLLNPTSKILDDEQLIEFLASKNSLEVTPSYIGASIKSEVTITSIPFPTVVIGIQVLQQLLRLQLPPLIDIYINDDKTWGIRSASHVYLVSGNWEPFDTHMAFASILFIPDANWKAGGDFVLRNRELSSISNRCVQVMNSQEVFSDKNRKVLHCIRFATHDSKWYAYSTDGRTMTELEVKTPQNENPSDFNLHKDTVRLFRAFEKVHLRFGVTNSPELDSISVIRATLSSGPLTVQCMVKEVTDAYPDVASIFRENSNGTYKVHVLSTDVQQVVEKYLRNFPKPTYSVTNGNSHSNQYIELNFPNDHVISFRMFQSRSSVEPPDIFVEHITRSTLASYSNYDDSLRDCRPLFNARLLCNVLKGITEATPVWHGVTISWGSASSPILIESPLGRAIVMPMRADTN